jgi:pimeloyl-ACP methyl ester carboxylesterase
MAIIEVDGARVDVSQQGEGRDLVLLHSLLTDRSVFERVAPKLARKRRVTLVNLPGYGGSSPAGSDIESYAERIAALLEALRLPRETDVLGNGFGGFIAVALALRHGGRFDRLIAAPALAGFPEAAKAPFHRMAGLVSSQGMGAVLDAAIQRMLPAAFIEANPGIVAERKQSLAKADPACFATACLALAGLDFSKVLHTIKNPTLVIVGSEDATTPPALARELAAKIPGAKFSELRGCGHCPQIEDPDGFVAAVEGFLG